MKRFTKYKNFSYLLRSKVFITCSYLSVSFDLRYLRSLLLFPTIWIRPRLEAWSCLWLLKCSLSWLILPVIEIIWASDEPVSLSCFSNFFIVGSFTIVNVLLLSPQISNLRNLRGYLSYYFLIYTFNLLSWWYHGKVCV